MEALAPLALLACPVGMGLMMWMMMKGSKGAESHPAPAVELRDGERRL